MSLEIFPLSVFLCSLLVKRVFLKSLIFWHLLVDFQCFCFPWKSKCCTQCSTLYLPLYQFVSCLLLFCALGCEHWRHFINPESSIMWCRCGEATHPSECVWSHPLLRPSHCFYVFTVNLQLVPHSSDCGDFHCFYSFFFQPPKLNILYHKTLSVPFNGVVLPF